MGATVRYGNGEYIVTGLGGTAVDGLIEDYALQATRGPTDGADLSRPALGIYRPWNPSMDEGWTRWLLEEHGFSFSNLRTADVHAEDLRDRYDVIVLPSEGSGSLMNGFGVGSVPPRYEGGLGQQGVRALDEFVRAGGTLVCMNASSDLCIDELYLPVSNVTRGLARSEFFSSGSIFEVRVDAEHPVMAGMPRLGKIFFDRSPVFSTEEGFEGSVIAAYAQEGSPLLSGYLLGEEHLQGQAAAVDVHHGDGHVILLGFRPQWRGQPRGTFRVLFNASLFHGSVARNATGTEGFWERPEKEEGEDPN